MANMGYDEHHPPATTPGAVSEKGQATPWNDDYENPVSEGPVNSNYCWHGSSYFLTNSIITLLYLSSTPPCMLYVIKKNVPIFLNLSFP